MTIPRILSFLLFPLLFISCNNKTAVKTQQVNKNVPKAEFTLLSPVEHDFGIYEEKENKSCWFVYKNTGKKPLVIQNAVADCGCTTVQFSKKALLPGRKDSLMVTYDGNGFLNGAFHKVITITSNGSAAPVEVTIKGEFSGN